MRIRLAIATIGFVAVVAAGCSTDDVDLTTEGDATPTAEATSDDGDGSDAAPESTDSSDYDPTTPMTCGELTAGGSNAGVFVTIDNRSGQYVASPLLFTVPLDTEREGVPLTSDDLAGFLVGNEAPDEDCIIELIPGFRFLEAGDVAALDIVMSSDHLLGVAALVPCTGQVVGGIFQVLSSDEVELEVVVSEPIDPDALAELTEKLGPAVPGCAGGEPPLTSGGELVVVSAMQTS